MHKPVIETLPTLLQLSLFFFFIAQIDFFWPINTTVAFTLIGFLALSFSFYVGTTLIAIFASGSPFQTRLSALLYRVKVYFLPSHDDDDDDDVIGASCVYWLLQTTTLPDALAASVKALTTLSMAARDMLHLDVMQVLQSLLRPSIVDSKIQWGISTESLCLSLPELFQLLQNLEETSWDDFLLPVSAFQVKRSLRSILMKTMLSFSADAEATKWVPKVLSLPSLREEKSSTELDPLHSFLLHNLPNPPSYDDLYTNMATICLHIKHSSPASEAAATLGIPFDSLEEHVSARSLDVFFDIPTSPNEPVTSHHPSFISFIEDQGRCPSADIREAVKVAHKRFEAQKLASLVSKSNWIIPDTTLDDLTLNPTNPTQLMKNHPESSQPLNPGESTLHLSTRLLQSHLFSWLEGLALSKQMDTAIPFLKRTQDWLTVSFPLDSIVHITNSSIRL